MDGFNKKKKILGGQQGFSLVELMVVVAIIGVLSALAVPRFRVFQAKARQAEAKTNLSHIYTLQQAYHGDNDVYVNLSTTGFSGSGTNCPDNDLGFELNPCEKSRYGYQVADAATDVFTAEATSGSAGNNRVLPGCQADEWTIDHDKVLTAVTDVTRACN